MMKWTALIFIASALLAAACVYLAAGILLRQIHVPEEPVEFGMMVSLIGLAGSLISFLVFILRAIVHRIRERRGVPLRPPTHS